jgi:hypothetical protein
MGVLGMTVQLGTFGELRPGERQGSTQVAALIDGREDAPGQRGLILQHPYLSDLLLRKQPLPWYRLPPQHLAQVHALRQALAAHTPTTVAQWTLPAYVDPVGGDYAGTWLAAIDPVQAAGRDTVWVVLVQERSEHVTGPVLALRLALRRIVIYGFVGLVLVLGILSYLVLRSLARGGAIVHDKYWIKRLSESCKLNRVQPTIPSTIAPSESTRDHRSAGISTGCAGCAKRALRPSGAAPLDRASSSSCVWTVIRAVEVACAMSCGTASAIVAGVGARVRQDSRKAAMVSA